MGTYPNAALNGWDVHVRLSCDVCVEVSVYAVCTPGDASSNSKVRAAVIKQSAAVTVPHQKSGLLSSPKKK
jgi:hypothetical protein